MPPSQRDREDSSEMIASLRMAYTRYERQHKSGEIDKSFAGRWKRAVQTQGRPTGRSVTPARSRPSSPSRTQGHPSTSSSAQGQPTERPVRPEQGRPSSPSETQGHFSTTSTARGRVSGRSVPLARGRSASPHVSPTRVSRRKEKQRLQEQEDRDNSGDEYRGDQEETNKDDAQTEDEDADGADILDASNTNAKTPTTRKDKIFTTVTPMSQAAKEYTLPQGVRRATVAELEALSDYHNQGDTTYQWLNRMPAIFKTKPEKTATGQKNCPAAVDNLYLDLSFRRITRMLAFQRLKIEVPELTPFHHLIDIPTPNTK